jgi:hypothetical protein
VRRLAFFRSYVIAVDLKVCCLFPDHKESQLLSRFGTQGEPASGSTQGAADVKRMHILHVKAVCPAFGIDPEQEGRVRESEADQPPEAPVPPRKGLLKLSRVTSLLLDCKQGRSPVREENTLASESMNNRSAEADPYKNNSFHGRTVTALPVLRSLYSMRVGFQTPPEELPVMVAS